MITLLTMLASVSVANVDIRSLLAEQGFGGLVNGREAISYVGHIEQGQNDYQIYAYRGLFKASVIDHGVNWLIVIKNGSILLGGYHIPVPADCKVHGQSVVCDTKAPGVVEFTKRGPPREILFDGEVLQFEYGTELKAS